MHLSILIVESIKNLTFSKTQLLKRIKYKNPEIIQDLLLSGRNVILVSGHFGNWEWIISSLGIHFEKNLFGLGMPMSKSFWDEAINERRQRFGLKVIHSKNHFTSLSDVASKPFINLMLADQSPGDSNKSYWMEFLNQQTAVQFGTETMANDHDAAVVYYEIIKSKPGKMEVVFHLITANPRKERYGMITESFTRHLEEHIKTQPELWMWSHKRWKREVPSNLDDLKNKLALRFNEKYRNN